MIFSIASHDGTFARMSSIHSSIFVYRLGKRNRKGLSSKHAINSIFQQKYYKEREAVEVLVYSHVTYGKINDTYVRLRVGDQKERLRYNDLEWFWSHQFKEQTPGELCGFEFTPLIPNLNNWPHFFLCFLCVTYQYGGRPPRRTVSFNSFVFFSPKFYSNIVFISLKTSRS